MEAEEGTLLGKWYQLARKFENCQLEEIAGTSDLIDKNKWQQAYFHSVQVNIVHMFIKLSHDPSGDETQSIWLQYNFLTNGRLYLSELEPFESEDDEEPDLVFCFENGEFLAFYDGRLDIVPGPCRDVRTDILSDSFDRDRAARALVQQDAPVCNILMDPSYFCGLWNIIKNEVLFKCKLHPLEIGKNICRRDAEYLVDELVKYSKEWLGWKVPDNPVQFAFGGKMYWNFECPHGHHTLRGNFGETKQMTVWCPQCQVLKRHMPIHRKFMESVNIPESSNANSDDVIVAGDVPKQGSHDYDGDDEEEINGHHQKGMLEERNVKSYEIILDSDVSSNDSAIEMKSLDDDIEVLGDFSCIMSSNYKLQDNSKSKTSRKKTENIRDHRNAIVEQNLLKVYPNLQKPISVNVKKLTKDEIERFSCKYTRCRMNVARRSFNRKWHDVSHCNKGKRNKSKYSQGKSKVSKTTTAHKLSKESSTCRTIKRKHKWNVSSESKEDELVKGVVKDDAMIKTPSGVFKVDNVTK